MDEPAANEIAPSDFQPQEQSSNNIIDMLEVEPYANLIKEGEICEDAHHQAQRV